MTIELPGRPSAAPPASEALSLSLDADGRLIAPDGRTIGIDGLRRDVLLERARDEGLSVRLSVADALGLQAVVTWLDALQDAGVAAVSVPGLMR